MFGYNRMSYQPYYPIDMVDEGLRPYVCRLAPQGGELELEWFDKGAPAAKHTLYYAERGGEQWTAVPLTDTRVKLSGFPEDHREYQLYVEREDGTRSNIRLWRTGHVAGRVINYLHPEDPQYAFVGQFLASPSITRLDDGTLLASMDVFHVTGPRNLSLLFRSDDDGANWSYVTDLFPCFWGTLFTHRGTLYILNVSNKYGNIQIASSSDGGYNWSAPTVLMHGACVANRKGFHRAPMPIISHNGRLWVSMDFGGWESHAFDAILMSLDENDDPMVAENWCFTKPTPHDKAWEGAAERAYGGIEGNAVVAPDGRVATMLRYNESPRALRFKNDLSDPHAPLAFWQVADFPMGHTKYEVRRHPNGTYYAAGNTYPARNCLSLYRSADLEKWELVEHIVDRREASEKEVGYQYPAFLFNGEREILLLSRTADNYADTFHNSNYITFHRVNI